MCTAAAAKSLQSCLTPCDPIDGRPPGSGILQARVLEWVAIINPNSQEILSLCSLLEIKTVGFGVGDSLQTEVQCDGFCPQV